MPYSQATIGKNRPSLYVNRNTSIPSRPRRATKLFNTHQTQKENVDGNRHSYGYYLEQVRTLNKMKLNLHEVHSKVQPEIKQRLLKSLKHMEQVVS